MFLRKEGQVKPYYVQSIVLSLWKHVHEKSGRLCSARFWVGMAKDSRLTGFSSGLRPLGQHDSLEKLIWRVRHNFGCLSESLIRLVLINFHRTWLGLTRPDHFTTLWVIILCMKGDNNANHDNNLICLYKKKLQNKNKMELPLFGQKVKTRLPYTLCSL